MGKAIYFLWYVGVAAAAVMLVAAFMMKSWPLTAGALVLGLVLQKTNSRVALASVYEKLGITNDMFEGKARDEKNNQ